MSSVSSTGISSSTGTATSSSGTSTSSSSASGSSGQAILSSAGIGSGLNVDAIVSALVNAKKAGPQAQITAQTTQAQAQQAGLTALSTSLAALQSALSTLTTSSTFASYTATLGDTTIGTTSTLSSAQPGSYDLSVTQLATAQKRASDSYSTGATPGAGSLTITVGSSSMVVNTTSTTSLSDLASSINNASGNPGVVATVVTTGTGTQQLLLSSANTGTANAFTISASSDSASGLQTLATKLNTAGSNEAQDAQLSIDGIAVTSGSNSVSGVLNGVTLNLTKTGSTTLTVAQDTTTATNAINAFVTAYNNYLGTVQTLTSYDSTTGQSGVLFGDSMMASLQRQVSGVLGSTVGSGSYNSLATLGITRTVDGNNQVSLSVDSDTLAAALKANPDAVQSLFAGTSGIATSLNNTLDTFTSSDGIIATRNASLTKQLSNLSDETTALNARMSVYQSQLYAQYTALDTLMSQLNNTSTYLTTLEKQMEGSNN